MPAPAAVSSPTGTRDERARSDADPEEDESWVIVDTPAPAPASKPEDSRATADAAPQTPPRALDASVEQAPDYGSTAAAPHAGTADPALNASPPANPVHVAEAAHLEALITASAPSCSGYHRSRTAVSTQVS